MWLKGQKSFHLEISNKRIGTPEIPIKAIREMVVNAFAHAFYENVP